MAEDQPPGHLLVAASPTPRQSAERTAMTVVDLLARRRVVPMVVLQDPSAAKPLAEALTAGGLPLAEVTFRTAAAAETVAAMAEDPALTVGAGTVISVDQVDAAVAAGARFIARIQFGGGPPLR